MTGSKAGIEMEGHEDNGKEEQGEGKEGAHPPSR